GLRASVRHAVPVPRPQGLQPFQHHQSHRSLPDVRSFAHRSSYSSYGVPISICYRSYGNAIEETKDPRHFVSGCFKFSWAPPFLTLPKLPTSLIRLPLRLPGDGCPFKAFTRSLAC